MPTKKPTATTKTAGPIRDGNKVFIRTVTHYYTGEIVRFDRDEIVIKSAAWVADTGRFSAALASGSLSEVEPYPDKALVSVARGSVCDVADWLHALPRGVK